MIHIRSRYTNCFRPCAQCFRKPSAQDFSTRPWSLPAPCQEGEKPTAASTLKQATGNPLQETAPASGKQLMHLNLHSVIGGVFLPNLIQNNMEEAPSTRRRALANNISSLPPQPCRPMKKCYRRCSPKPKERDHSRVSSWFRAWARQAQ